VKRSKKAALVITDRYAGGRGNGCKGPCEGMGFYPKRDPKNPKADAIGYVFLLCPKCKGRSPLHAPAGKGGRRRG
jgi:hypothetical protein